MLICSLQLLFSSTFVVIIDKTKLKQLIVRKNMIAL